MTLEIRDAVAADEARWRILWADYVAFYGVTVAPEATTATWQRAMDPACPLFMKLAVIDGTVAGFALCLVHVATWVKEPVLYMEDLFLDVSARGRGAGKALMDELVDLAKANGWSRLYWHTEEANATARRLYDHYTLADTHVRYRMSF